MAESIPDYDELKLRIERAPDDAYRVLAFGPDGSTAEGTFSAPFTKPELDDFVRHVGLPRRKARAYRSTRMEEARGFGDRLRAALLRGDVRDVYLGARRVAESKHRGLRVTLYLTGVPELMEIPWEFLYERPSFLAQSIYTPVVRSLDLKEPRPPRKVTLPLRVLGVVSNPDDSLDVDDERRKLEQALDKLRSRGMVHLHWLERATLAELERVVGAPDEEHVLHYIGHGAYDEQTEDGILILENARGRPHEITGEELCSVLQDERSLRLAVLNSCEGARTSHVDPFSGVASSLVECGIPAVIGMQFEITDDAAITFSQRLYTALSQGYPVDAALAQARRAIFAGGHDIEFGTPVLFLRGTDARLFDVEPGHGLPAASAAAPGRLRARAARIGANLSRLRSRRVLAGAALVAIAAIVALALMLPNGPDESGETRRVVTGPQATELLERFASRFTEGDLAGVSAVLSADLRAHALANPVLDKNAAVNELRPAIESGSDLTFNTADARVEREGRTIVEARYSITPRGGQEDFGDATFEVRRGQEGAILITRIQDFPDLVWAVDPPDLHDFTAAARVGDVVVAEFDFDPSVADDLRMFVTDAGRGTLRDGTDVTFAYSGFTAAGREMTKQETVKYQRFPLLAPPVTAPANR